MGERPAILERLRRLLGLGDEGEAAGPPSGRRAGGGPSSGDGEVPDIACEEAARRVYEYLDGELAEGDAEAVRRHLERCERCYPMYDWERLFLDTLKEGGDRPEPSDELRRRVLRLLDREAG